MVAVIATTVAAGQPVTAVGLAGWLALGSLPPLVLLMAFRGSAPARMSHAVARAVRVIPNAAPVRTNVIDR